MSFISFEALSGPLKKLSSMSNIFATKIKYGVNCDVKMKFLSKDRDHTTLASTSGDRPGALFSNSATSLGLIDCEVIEDIPVYDGINVECINPNGSIDPTKVIAALKSNMLIEMSTVHPIATYIAEYPYDNVVSVLYNLLRMYYIKVNGNCVIDGSKDAFNDGRIIIDMITVYNIEKNKKIKLIDSVDIRPIHIDNIHKDMPLDGNNVIVSGALLTNKDISVLAFACGDFDSKGPFRVAHSSNRLTQVLFTCQKYPAMQHYDSFSELQPLQIRGALTRFVETHRYQAQFDMAYALLVQTLMTHEPRSAEAFYWLSKKAVMRLPRAGSFRGLSTMLIANEAIITDQKRWMTFKYWSENSNRATLHSIALSEAIHASYFEAATDFDMQKDIDGLCGIVSYREAGLMMEFALASRRLGIMMALPWQTRCGMDRYGWLLSSQASLRLVVTPVESASLVGYDIQLPSEEDKLERTQMYLMIRKLVPCTFPVLTMGAKIKDYYMADMEYDISIDFDQETSSFYSFNPKIVNKFMAIMRIAGQDAACQYTVDDDDYITTNWNTSLNGHYVPDFSKDAYGSQRYDVHIDKIAMKRKAWCSVPDPAHHMQLIASLEQSHFTIICDRKKINSFLGKIKEMEFQPPVTRAEAAKIDPDYCQYVAVNVKTLLNDYRATGFTLVEKGNRPETLLHLYS